MEFNLCELTSAMTARKLITYCCKFKILILEGNGGETIHGLEGLSFRDFEAKRKMLQ